jgi:uncharacterized protein (DUF362 family)
MMKDLTRRDFLRGVAILGGLAAIVACTPQRLPKQALESASTAIAQAGTAPSVSKPPATDAATPSVAALTNTPTPTQLPATPVARATAARPTGTATNAPASPTVPQQPTSAAQTPSPAPASAAYLAVARGPSPEALVTQALAAIGGIERFVKRGYNVIVKPNICVAGRGPEFAATTNPEVMATLVKLCLGAGAKSVRVMDYPFSGTAQQAYVSSGIGDAVKAAGGAMELMAEMKFADTPIPSGKDLKSWQIYQPILQADLVINVPIAKDHGLARLTLAGKNLMGVIQDRGSIHRDLGQRIADLASLIKPQLTIIDAVRILMANGPTGGNLADVKQANTIIASQDMVAADAYAATLFGLTAKDIAYIGASAQMGLGTMDLKSIKVAEMNL